MENVQVKETSKETIKPSIPTSSDHKTFTLSFIDQTFPAVHLPLLLFYTNSTNKPTVDIVDSLRKSLPDALTAFYPLAGRCEGENIVLCNDQGIPFYQTDVDCRLTDVLHSPRKLDVLPKLLPPKDIFSFGHRPSSEVVHLAFQVNVFLCGGVVIGCYMLHKMLDATSISAFLNHWAALASGRQVDLVQPDFNAAVSAFPPPPVLKAGGKADDADGNDSGKIDGGPSDDVAKLWSKTSNPIKVVGKSFVFSDTAIKVLKAKAKAATNDERTPNPTSFESVSAFIWQQVMEAGAKNGKQTVPSVMLFNGNIRPRTNPTLPKESIGNLILGAHATCAEDSSNLSDLVKEIHTQVLDMVGKVGGLKGENRVKAFLEAREGGSHSKSAKYYLTSWCRLGFETVDFGFGKPDKIVPLGMIHPLLRNFIFLVDNFKSGGVSDGVEVWLFLEEKEMLLLESNPEFLALIS